MLEPLRARQAPCSLPLSIESQDNAAQKVALSGDTDYHAVQPSPSQWVRLWRLSVCWSVLLAALNGSLVTLQAGFALSPFGGFDWVPGIASLSIIRVLAAGAAGSGTVLALVHWAHGREPARLKQCLRSTLVHGFLGTVAMTSVSSLVALASSFGTGLAIYGIGWTTFCGGLQRIVTLADCIVGLGVATASGLILVPLVGFLLPSLARTNWSLAAKMLAIWLGLFVLNAAGRILADGPWQ